jgi:hypothetical protein
MAMPLPSTTSTMGHVSAATKSHHEKEKRAQNPQRE